MHMFNFNTPYADEEYEVALLRWGGKRLRHFEANLPVFGKVYV